MCATSICTLDLKTLRKVFGDCLSENISLARYTAARLGGPADALIEAHSADELVTITSKLWQLEQPFILLGGGSNVLVSDRGVRSVVILNKARSVSFGVDLTGRRLPPSKRSTTKILVWAESGTNFGNLARKVARRGLSGLEWAVGIPGTLGGAIYGNAGAHGSDMSSNLLSAEILHRTSEKPFGEIEKWTLEKFDYAYRTSNLKRQSQAGQFGDQPDIIVLTALLQLEQSEIPDVQARIDEYSSYRKRTQPKGASLGSMFKNPPGDFAGRLIDAAGLKGLQVGGAQISPTHGNFFINKGNATASDLSNLIELTRKAVVNRFGIELELEIELLGEW